ncbi:MAG: O-antigen ligase family protein [Acidobacteriota bacterium]
MPAYHIARNWKEPAFLFAAGWAAVMLALWIIVIPAWDTFIHMWRTELAASILLASTLLFAIWNTKYTELSRTISRSEYIYLVVPILLFITWSSISTAWAPSWKSAVHHSLVWCEYLIFFLIVRHLLRTRADHDRLLYAVVISIVLFAIPAVLEYCAVLVFGGATTLGIRFAKFGEQINTVYPLVTLAVLRLRGKQFALGTFCIAFMWLLIFCSFSRINLFLFGVSTAVIACSIFIFRPLRKFRSKMAIVVLALVIAPFPLHLASLMSEDFSVPVVQRMTNDDALSSSNNFRKLIASIAFEMFSAKRLTGVGADNFGMQLNYYRAEYASKYPEDPNLASAESDIPERAHNEYLQIAAELGTVGIVIFICFLAGIGMTALRVLRTRRLRLESLAAVLGLAMFMASSLVSSYSFRLIQNGFVFFFVLAVLAKFSSGRTPDEPPATTRMLNPERVKLALGFGVIICLSLGAYSVVRVTSVIYTKHANYVQNTDEAALMYKQAMWLDDENPDAPNILGLRLLREGKYSESIPYLQRSIDIGKAPSADFSYLATAHWLSGHCSGAVAALAQGATLYPRSPFVLTRYAEILKRCGDTENSVAQLQRALTINKSAANTWWAMLNDGPRAASERASVRDDFSKIMDLQPQNAIYAVMAEREIMHPAERFKFDSPQ